MVPATNSSESPGRKGKITTPVSQKMMAKSSIATQDSEFVTAVQPIRTGTAPAAPPMTMLWVDVRFSQRVYTNT